MLLLCTACAGGQAVQGSHEHVPVGARHGHVRQSEQGQCSVLRCTCSGRRAGVHAL